MPSVDDSTQVFATFPSSSTPTASAAPSTTAVLYSTAAAAGAGVSPRIDGSTTADVDAFKRNFESINISKPTQPRANMTVSSTPAAKVVVHEAPAAAASSDPVKANPSGTGRNTTFNGTYANDQTNHGRQTNVGQYGHNHGTANLVGLFGPGALSAQQAHDASIQAQQTQLPQNGNNHLPGHLAHPHAPRSPYLTVDGSPADHQAVTFGSPVSQNGMLPGQSPTYPGSNYDFDPSLSMPASPNPYAPTFAPGFGGPALGFGAAGANPSMMSPLLGMNGMNGMDSMQMAAAAAAAAAAQTYSMGYSSVMNSPDFGLSANAQTGRTVYVGNLPSDASVDELLSQVRFGPIESIRILPEKSCAFISFLDPTTAAAFHSDALMRKVRLHEQDLKIGWGKPSAVPPSVLTAVQQNGATRNVYLGNLDETVTEQSLRDDLSRFGPIDQVKIVRDKNIGFVHFLSIATAIKVVTQLANEPEYAGRRVSFGKDRTAYVPKNQHQQQQHNMAAAAMGAMAANWGFGSPALGFGSEMGSPLIGSPNPNDPNAQPGNRTVYLGNIHPDTTTEEICNMIRGGILQQIRYIPEKHICFVTFVEPQCALAFYQTASFQGLALHSRRLKVGWGKNAGPTSPGIAMVVQSGGSRNVYVGNIEDFDKYTVEKLRNDFGEYGEIEMINSLREKQCCFINFTNIANSIKAIEGMKSHPDYQHLKISFGKDRCGGAPRAFRGLDMKRRGQRSQQPAQQDGQSPMNGFPPSSFAEGMPFPDMGSPMPMSAFDPVSMVAFATGEDEGDDEDLLPSGPGALELDETVAAAATSSPGRIPTSSA